MSAQNLGGPAFPIPHQENSRGDVVTYMHDGMTLRDYFAAKAMQEAMSWDGMDMEDAAATAYAAADAMLAERAK